MVFRSPLQTPVMKSTGINRQKAAFHRNAAFILLFLMYNKNNYMFWMFEYFDGETFVSRLNALEKYA